METARIAAGGAQADARLRELDFGDLEGRRWEEIGPSVQAALLRFEGARPPGGESVEELRGRVEGFLSSLAPGRHLVFTHGGVIRMLLRDRGCDRVVAPGSITVLPWRGAGG
jgi:probable phosphoglycerate mutase